MTTRDDLDRIGELVEQYDLLKGILESGDARGLFVTTSITGLALSYHFAVNGKDLARLKKIFEDLLQEVRQELTQRGVDLDKTALDSPVVTPPTRS